MKKTIIRWISVLCVITLCITGIAAGAEAETEPSQDIISSVAEGLQDLSISSDTAGNAVLSVTDPAAEETNTPDPMPEEAGTVEQGIEVTEISQAADVSEPESEEPETADPTAGQTDTDALSQEDAGIAVPIEEESFEESEAIEPVTEKTEAVQEIVIETVIEEQPEIRTEEALVPVLEEIIIDQQEEEQAEESLDVTEDKDTLSYGMYSNAVTQLQEALRNKGYEIWPDGYYGDDTYTIVKVFQMYNGLPVNGIADERVQKLAKGNGIGFYGMMKGSNSMAVAATQSFLHDLGYLYADIDGDFGPYTEEAVRLFQEKNELYVDGIVGMKTLRAILINPVTADVITRSDIIKFQTYLDQLGFLQSNIDGDFGSYTKRALKEFQMYNGLNITGDLDEETIAALRSSGAQAYYELRQGATGYPVQILQTFLKDLGYLSFAPDGDYGEMTRLAVAKFQAMNRLTVDGVARNYVINKLLMGGLAYDPTTDHVISQAEELAQMAIDQLGWDLYTAYRWSSDFPHTHAYTGLTLSSAAVYGFTYGMGDCMAKAATFCMMARALGYQCKVFFGYVPYSDGTYADHAWCEIEYYGTTYVCDPSFEYGSGKNGFMINYGQSGTLKYSYGRPLEE